MDERKTAGGLTMLYVFAMILVPAFVWATMKIAGAFGWHDHGAESMGPALLFLPSMIISLLGGAGIGHRVKTHRVLFAARVSVRMIVPYTVGAFAMSFVLPIAGHQLLWWQIAVWGLIMGIAAAVCGAFSLILGAAIGR